MLLDALPTEKQSLERMSPREQQLWYFTQHFSDLQGLKILPAFTAFGLFVYFSSALRNRHTPVFSLLALGCGGFVLVAVCTVWVQRWYEAHYGIVQNRQTKSEMRDGFLPAAWLLLFLMLGLSLRPHVPATAISVFSTVSVLLLPKCFYRTTSNRWVQLRQWLYRLGAAGVVGLIGYAELAHVSRDTPRQIIVGLCMTFALLGIFDHWLLTHLARPGHEEKVER
jgi:hypothetical protein